MFYCLIDFHTYALLCPLPCLLPYSCTHVTVCVHACCSPKLVCSDVDTAHGTKAVHHQGMQMLHALENNQNQQNLPPPNNTWLHQQINTP